MKKIRNPRTGSAKIHYFGRWGRVVQGSMQRLPGDGAQEALKLWNAQKDDLLAGREPQVKSLDDLNEDGTLKNPALTLGRLGNRFLNEKLRKKTASELTQRSFLDYRATTDLLIAHFGKHKFVEDLVADDFGDLRAEMATKWGPVRLSREVTQVKSVFKFADENGLIERPIRYGSQFDKPSKSVLRKHKAASEKKTLSAAEIRELIDKADPIITAWILLAMNCGLGNSDLSNLQKRHIDGEWLNYPQPKTGIERRCPLWVETRKAIEEALEVRPQPADPETDGGCVFLSKRGRRLVTFTKKAKVDRVAFQFAELAKAAKVHRKGVGFYAIRHTFQSVADTGGTRSRRNS